MKELTEDSIALLRRMVRVPALSFEEQEVSELIYGTLVSWGIDCQRYGRNILAFNKLYDPSRPTLVFDAHIDTVPPAQSYTRDPYDPGEEADTVWGLGSNDDGGSVVSMIAAFRHFYGQELPINIALALSCEEERSGPDGARMLYSEEGPLAPGKAEWVIVGEPTGMRAAIAEKGLLVLDCEAHGVSGHAARGEGVNALYIAMEDIAAMKAHRFERVSPKTGEVRLTVTQINAGTAHNVVPDSCSFVVDIRPNELYSNEEIVEQLRAKCRSDIVPRNLTNRSSATYEGSPLERTASALGIGTFSSPTTSNWMRTGRDAIKMGPGDSSRSHKANEYIFCSEIEEAVKKYINFVENFYGNTLE